MTNSSTPKIQQLSEQHSHSENLRTHIGNAPETSCEMWAATCTPRCASIHPSSQNVCHRKNWQSSPDKTETPRNRETARIRWKSTPTRCRLDRELRTRWPPPEKHSPA